MKKSFAASLFAALLLALGTGAAFAGNGHGNGQDSGGQPQSQGQSHDQSSSQQPDQQAQHGHESGGGTVQSGGSNDQGVKPDSSTKHDTYARADSDKTKQYGNGKTAGQIATSRGASGDTVLHGPGNSQPHKVLACGHKHEVDVHAVKSYSSASCDEHPEKHDVAGASHEQKQVETCAKTVTVTVPAGVWHDQGSHWVRSGSRHEGDVEVSESTTRTITIADACKRSESSVREAAFQQAVTKCGHRVESVVKVQEQKPAAVAPAAVEAKKVYICHATGSATNPYVLIHVSKHAEQAHTRHQDERDIVLGESVGSGCPQAAAVTTTTTVPATTTTVEQLTQTVAAQAAVAPATTTTTAEAVPVAAGVLPAQAAQSAPPAESAPVQGGVLGAQATIAPPKAQPAGGGVLGTTTRIASSRLPFTGVELWIFALVAAALIAAGTTLRRSGRGTL